MNKATAITFFALVILVSGQEFTFETSTGTSQIDSSTVSYGVAVEFTRDTRLESLSAYVKFAGDGSDVTASFYIQNYNESDSSESFVYETNTMSATVCNTTGCTAWVMVDSLNATLTPGVYCIAVRLDKDYYSFGSTQNNTDSVSGLEAFANYMNYGCVFNTSDGFIRTFVANSEMNFIYKINGYASYDQCTSSNGGCPSSATCSDSNPLSSDSVNCTCPDGQTISSTNTCVDSGAAAGNNKPSYGNGDPGLSVGVPIAIIVGILLFTAIAYIVYTKAWRNLGKSNAKSPNNLEMQNKKEETEAKPEAKPEIKSDE